MSVTPRVVNVTDTVNSYTVVTDHGATDGLDEGDRVMVSVEGDHAVGTIVDIGPDSSVVELRTTR